MTGVTVDLDHVVTWWVREPAGLERWLIAESIGLAQAQDAVMKASTPEGATDIDDDLAVGGHVAPFGDSAAVEVLYCEDPEIVRRWLTGLVTALEEAGCSGRLVPWGKPWDKPVDPVMIPSTPTAYFAWRLHQPPLALEDWRAHWGVDADLTATVMRRAAAWCLNVGGEITLEVDHGPASVVSATPGIDGITARLISALVRPAPPFWRSHPPTELRAVVSASGWVGSLSCN